MDPSRSPERRTRKTSVGRGNASGGASRAALGSDTYTSRSTTNIASSPSSATATAASSRAGLSASSRRTHQFLGGDDRLILDVGARVTKAGHSGEARPRDVLWSLRRATPADRVVDASCQGLLWTLDIARCRDDAQRRIVEYALRARIKHFLRALVYDTLTHDPKQRKVVIVENGFMPTMVKEALRDVLFGNISVQSVSFVPSHLMCAIAIGRMSALVVDIGYEQATLVPVHLWRPMTPRYLFTSSRVSAKRLSRRLRALLLHFGSYYAPPLPSPAATSMMTSNFSSLREAASSTMTRKGKVPADVLDDDTLDLIKAKALLVGPPLRDADDAATITASTVATDTWQGMPPYSDMDEESEEAWMNALTKRYENTKGFTEDMSIRLPARNEAHRPLLVPASQPSTLNLGAANHDRNSSGGVIIVPGWIRDRAAEVFFEQHSSEDDGEGSVAEMILDALLKLPIDLRQVMANNVYIVGGTAMLPGLAHRVRRELVRTLAKAAKYVSDAPAKFGGVALSQPVVGARQRQPKPRALSDLPDQSFVSARGGDESFVTTNEGEQEGDVEEDKAIGKPADGTSLRPSNANAKYAPLIALLPSIAVINDHAPRLQTDGSSVTGAAPSFAVNTSAWIGASLIASLRVDSLDPMHRDEWEEAQERVRRAAEAAKKEASERPSLGLGRGSFLGTVGGLDLGSYGPLSTGTRSKFSTGAASVGNPRSPKGST